jgi:phosphoribosylanthranilate isomerase
MWIKICANTNLEDAQAAAELGADAIGFVFATSKRQVTASQVAAITPYLPRTLERVGVFDTDDVDAIVAAVERAGLTAVQMHGGVNLKLAHQLQARLGPQISMIETTHWSLTDGEAAAHRVSAALAEVAGDSKNFRLLVDAKVGSTSGGLGVSFEWSQAQPVLASQPDVRTIVAGGLRPDNVAEAIRVLKPWGVDVASGVEQQPGKKDYAKLKQFIQAAREAH